MKFLYEKQTRKFYLFLAGVLLLQTGCLGLFCIFQARNVRSFLVRRELAAASYLLEQDIPPAVIASALNHTEATEAGAGLLSLIGHTEQNRSYLLLLMEQVCLPSSALLLLPGLGSASVILAGAAYFLERREQMYEEAEQVIAQYAEDRFRNHLPAGQTGAIYRLFGGIEELAQSLQAKSEMEHRTKIFLRNIISNISHQLKTPLAALSMYMEIMMDEPGNEEAVRNFSQKSLQSVEQMEQLIRSLLKMARLDTGMIVFEKKQCRISGIVEQAVNDLQERARQEGKRIRTEGPAGKSVWCDPEWTKEAVGNLVKNALDHTETGGIIRILWEETPGVFRLSVADNGCGIAEEDIHHIFKQFYRSRTSGDRQGAGLGLSLAKTIMEGQGGNLSVKSTPGEGSVFYMTFLTDL